MFTISKYFQVMISESKLKEEIRGITSSDCWGAYTQKQWVNEYGGDGEGINDKYVYFDTIALDLPYPSYFNLNPNAMESEKEKYTEYLRQESIREKLCTDVANELMDEVVAKINNGEILTLVMFENQAYGDVSFFKVGDNYVWTRTKQDSY
jgi:hypothetical protein